MNPLEIYKRLPRLNCGECPAGTCMALAVRLAGDEASLSECVKLNEGARTELGRLLSSSERGDWKERYLEELLDGIARMNLSKVAEGIGADYKEGVLSIRYMGKTVRVSNSGIETDLDIWDKLLILIYIRNAGKKEPSGKWTAFRDLKDGSVKASGFSAVCEKPIARIFDADSEGLIKVLELLGAKRVDGYSTQYSYILHPLPRIPFLILLWPGDEDFGSTCSVLLDGTATDHLDVEALTYLGEALVRAIRKEVAVSR